MTEHRKHSRQRTLKGGRIVFNQKRSVLTCTVRNLSSTGACLDVPSTVGILKHSNSLLNRMALIDPAGSLGDRSSASAFTFRNERRRRPSKAHSAAVMTFR
jgi:hypothetical protein